MDWSGSFCSLMALGEDQAFFLVEATYTDLSEIVAQNTFDVLGGVIYIVM